jgi:hypothetical protein
MFCTAAAAGFTDRTDPLTPSRLPLSTYTRNLAINHTSVFAAAQAALASFATLDADASRTFIYTGNGLNSARTAMLGIVDCGVGKAASANLIMALAQAYGGRGYKYVHTFHVSPLPLSLSLTNSVEIIDSTTPTSASPTAATRSP